MRKILITNDDGIKADGIIRLSRAALQFGEVWVVAPESQRSAASHSITLHTHIDVCPVDFPVENVAAWSCSGTPGDCVRVGGLSIMPEKPDVVLSGINYGYNAASDIQYSATCGAAFEAAFQGYHAIALSEQAVPCHEVTDAYLEQILEKLLTVTNALGQILNVNFPGCALEECRGILENRSVSTSMFYKDHYNDLEALPRGGRRLMVEGIYCEEAEEGTDQRALVNRYISIGAVNNIGYGIYCRPGDGTSQTAGGAE